MSLPLKTSPIQRHRGQLKIWMTPARFKMICAGRRFGKTTYSREKLSFSSEFKNHLYWYVAPTRGHAKELLWDELKQRFDELKWRYRKNETSLSITRIKTGTKITLKGAEKWDRLRGKGLNGIIFDEFADIDKRAWTEAVRPALSDKRGWADFLGTPKGLNHFYEMHQAAKLEEDWAAFTFKTIDSPFFQTPEGMKELESARRDLDDRTFRQEYEASFETFGGRIVYAFERAIHHVPHKFDSLGPIYVGMDFNRTPMSACLFQKINGKMIMFSELSIQTSSTDEMCRVIKQKFPNWRTQGIFVRPDATGKKKTSNFSKSDIEILKEHEFTVQVGESNPSRVDRWASCNRAFERGLCLIDVLNCPKTSRELETICYKEGTCEPDISNALTGHLFDAFGYNIYKEFPVVTQKQTTVRRYA